ncbi:hypothetical protein HIO71_11180 [Chryseobacterium aquaticum]|uniref:Uncharacterized protein n=1 Tax=Chryseobacterium aquaticum TaxID=452084 RepID=A0A848N7P0_9FLAO|nr:MULTISPECIES: hypothetical protein [Chryseobacterium]NMR34768.1 hypothetical protein [Chryseobacterium aquaticum]NRQ46844.1 hypothetical protein [Chryseobacterium sp. C-204]
MDIIAYFQSYINYFWEWTTDEDVPDDTQYNENNLISIPNVGAIAYRPYVMEILKELKEQRLPPFGSLLLVLYAIQDGYSNLDGVIYHLNKQKNALSESNSDIDFAIKFLINLSNVGSLLKKGQNKIILLQTIFKDSHNQVSSVNSGLILKVFEKRPHIIAEAATKKHLTSIVINRDIKTLALLQRKFPTTQSIVSAMRGSVEIPELEDEVVEEETTVETDKDFIQELIEEPKTFQVGSLIKRIWSGLKIPMRHLSPGEQPIGGISDMTNKGELHRMLLSEFANEDDIFMNRVANNEALFIQREIPPEENIFERIILIDTSLKNWGTPKVLAFASAIAVIKHPKALSECKVFALGQNIIPMSLDKVDEVVENLNHVSPVLEVSGALEKFFNEEHKEKDLEVFFITNQENLSHPNLQKIIHENRDRLKFLVTTSANGELNFYKYHKGTRKHIQKIMLPLQELWANPPERRHRRENKFSGNGKKTNVPFNYSILFPAPINKIATFLYEGEFFILSNKKQLLRTYLSDNYYNRNYYDTYKTHHGCEILIDDISVKPKGQFALAKNKQGDFILCQYQPDKKLISKLNLNTKEYSDLNLTGKNIPEDHQLIYFNRYFCLYNENSDMIHLITIEGNISLEYILNDKLIYRNHGKVQLEIKKLYNSGLKILNNFHNFGINTEKKLVISNNELIHYIEDSIKFYKNTSPLEICAEQNKNKFTFSDGSEIITDNRGMLTFKSSNKNIPEFYIPSTEYGNLALATNTEFGGSEYYLPQNTLLKVRTMEEMYVEYMERFIDQIWEYGT